MSIDLLTTVDILQYFSKIFNASPDDIKVDDISTNPSIPAGEVRISIYKGRLKLLSRSELDFISNHKLAEVKLIIIRRNKVFRFWHQEV